MLKDRNIDIQCENFNDTVTLVNPTLIVIKLGDAKVGINSVKNISSYMENYDVNHAIVLYNNNITVFAKNEIKSLQKEGKEIELFLYTELIYNITKHMLVPRHILMTNEEKKVIMKKYKVTDQQVPQVLRTDPVARYFNAKPGQMFKIIRDSNITYKSISYRVVI
jgi:DNA-directed RNA polymerase I, II, and III subunit RPABC1